MVTTPDIPFETPGATLRDGVRDGEPHSSAGSRRGPSNCPVRASSAALGNPAAG
jgi:hypothetical protein